MNRDTRYRLLIYALNHLQSKGSVSLHSDYGEACTHLNSLREEGKHPCLNWFPNPQSPGLPIYVVHHRRPHKGYKDGLLDPGGSEHLCDCWCPQPEDDGPRDRTPCDELSIGLLDA